MENVSSKLTIISIILIWLILIAVSGWVRPLYYSSEEMHYASLAWEMWQHHQFILPIEGGKPYAEKGPLLFWLIQLGWKIFGVSTWWMRLLPELFGLATLLLLRDFILKLWPPASSNGDEHLIANLAPLALLGSFFFAAKIPMMRFDVLTTFWVLLAIYSLVSAINTNKKYWWVFSISVALGLLTKGPVLFIFVLPAAISCRWWAECGYSWRSVYFYMIGALLFAILLSCAWLLPATWQGGSEYVSALLLHRSVGRIWHGHHYLQQNWFYYGFTIPLMLLPWIIWPTFWRSLFNFFRTAKNHGLNPGLRLLLMVIVSAFIFSTFVAEKAPRYILPALPFLIALITYILVKYQNVVKNYRQSVIGIAYIAVGLLYSLFPHFASLKMQTKYPWLQDISPWWGCCLIIIGIVWLCWRTTHFTKTIIGITVSTVLFWSCYNLGVTKAQAPFGDWRELALRVHQLQANHIPVAFAGNIQVLEFFGRLQQPLEQISHKNDLKLWAEQHPDGWIVVRNYKISPMQLELPPAVPLT